MLSVVLLSLVNGLLSFYRVYARHVLHFTIAKCKAVYNRNIIDIYEPCCFHPGTRS